MSPRFSRCGFGVALFGGVVGGTKIRPGSPKDEVERKGGLKLLQDALMKVAGERLSSQPAAVSR